MTITGIKKSLTGIDSVGFITKPPMNAELYDVLMKMRGDQKKPMLKDYRVDVDSGMLILRTQDGKQIQFPDNAKETLTALLTEAEETVKQAKDAKAKADDQLHQRKIESIKKAVDTFGVPLEI